MNDFQQYKIDIENGTIPIKDLPIGTRVTDLSWVWEFRQGRNYSNVGVTGEPAPQCEVRPVSWIIVAKDHYKGLKPHVTLLASELIGLYVFDNNTNLLRSLHGSNLWGESGAFGSTLGLRPWLNSNGIHESVGFYQAFSDSFKKALLATVLPNRMIRDSYREVYTTNDIVFIPSSTELGDVEIDKAYRIGQVYAYFNKASNADRIADLCGINIWYWTRSPDYEGPGCYVRSVDDDGSWNEFGFLVDGGSVTGVRPALNLKSDTLVTKIKESSVGEHRVDKEFTAEVLERVLPLNTEELKECPYCCELIKAKAIKCKHCKSFLDGR